MTCLALTRQWGRRSSRPGLVVAYTVLWAALLSAPPGLAAQAAAAPAEVVILATLHGTHRANASYTTDTLRDMIVRLNPAVILVELPPAIDGAATVVNDRIAGSLSSWNENISANAAAQTLHARMLPYDRAGRNEYYDSTHYFARQDSLNRAVDAWCDQGRARTPRPAAWQVGCDLLPDVVSSQRYLDRNATPRQINSVGYDALIRSKHMIWQEILPALLESAGALPGRGGEFAYFREEWEVRNRAMAGNIADIARAYAGRRIVVLCGSEHRYFLRQLLGGKTEVSLKEFYAVP